MPFEPDDFIAEDAETDAPGDAQATRPTTADKFDVSSSSDKLLDRLLYKGVLPTYAFPTDVVTFQ